MLKRLRCSWLVEVEGDGKIGWKVEKRRILVEMVSTLLQHGTEVA